MPDDLPAIDPSLDAPLPQMDPNSALVPYRMSRTEPGGQPIVTTGYGPRARPPIQPPEGFGGGVGMPSLDQIYNAAFSNLPVDLAIKAAEAATRFQGQRGYQRDLANGMSAAQAFAKWGPMLFHQATGIPEALQAELQRQKMNQPVLRTAGTGLYRVPPTGPAETLVPPKPPKPDIRSVGGGLYRVGAEGQPEELVKPKDKPKKVATITVPLDPDSPDGAKISGPPDDPDVMAAVKKHEDAARAAATPPPSAPSILERAKNFLKTSVQPSPAAPQEPPKVTTKEQYDALKPGQIYVGKDGKKYKKP